MKKYLVLLFLLSSLHVFAQDVIYDKSEQTSKMWFISTSLGMQMSGIKDEDFIKSNFSPAFSLNTGVWFTPEIALQFGYKGFYFNYIGDMDKHYYNFINGSVLINVNSLILHQNLDHQKWKLILYPGAGYFYNQYYQRPNVCAIFGMDISYSINNNIELYIDGSTIMGWDIYQGDDDIIPSCSIGLLYKIH